MKVVMTNFGIRLQPETTWECICLSQIANKEIVPRWQDRWRQEGDLIIEVEQPAPYSPRQ